jgi:membrane fusion protein (multidrug efflux system)
VEEGDTVQNGQVLAVLENASLDASFDRASADFDRARVNAEELEELESVGAVSARELAEAQYTLATARATREEAEKSQGFTRIVSPIQGTVATRDVRYGEIAAAGTRSFQVVDLSRLRVVVQLPERDLSRVSAGQYVQLTPTYDPSLEVEARVLRVAPVVDAASGTVRVTIALAPDEASVRPGQFVSVRIEVGRHDAAVIVPREAVLYDEGDPYVFVLIDASELEDKDDAKEGEDEDEDADAADEAPGFFARLFGGDDEEADEKEDEPEGPQRAVRRVGIETGFLELSRAEVTSGLTAGQQVITVGHETLRDEAAVRLEGDPVRGNKKDEEDADAEESDADTKEDKGDEATG